MSKKYNIKLHVNVEQINEKYGFSSFSTQTTNKNVTKFDELVLKQQQNDIISFVDDTKRMRKCVLSVPNTKCNCFWDKHPIGPTIIPIGCPIAFIPDVVTKTYFSEISKDNFSIKENVSETKYKSMIESEDNRISVEHKGYYETDGYFCSFDCCMAYIEDNKHLPKYKNSKFLLLKIFSDYTNAKTIVPASSWRTLIEYGGNVSIEKFRSSFNNIIYKSHGPFAKITPIGELFEEIIKF